MLEELWLWSTNELVLDDETDELDVDGEDHDEKVLLELVDELADANWPELDDVLLEGELSVDEDRVEEELVERLLAVLDDELLVPAFALELDVEDHDVCAVDVDEVLVDFDDQDEVDSLVRLDRLDVLEVEELLTEELDVLDSSRSPRTPRTARSTAMPSLTPAYWTRNRLAAAVAANPSSGASRIIEPPGPRRL